MVLTLQLCCPEQGCDVGRAFCRQGFRHAVDLSKMHARRSCDLSAGEFKSAVS